MEEGRRVEWFWFRKNRNPIKKSPFRSLLRSKPTLATTDLGERRNGDPWFYPTVDGTLDDNTPPVTGVRFVSGWPSAQALLKVGTEEYVASGLYGTTFTKATIGDLDLGSD